jgi:hypothetical protein
MCAHYENQKEQRYLRDSFNVEPPPTLGKVTCCQVTWIRPKADWE